MNPELAIQDGIYNEISILLSKADSVEKASALVAHYLQKKIGEGVIDMYDYTINDHGVDGYTASIEYSFVWNIANTCSMLVVPKVSPLKAFDHAMSII
jgi:hypothetical protein